MILAVEEDSYTAQSFPDVFSTVETQDFTHLVFIKGCIKSTHNSPITTLPYKEVSIGLSFLRIEKARRRREATINEWFKAITHD